jgi:hypothetical protein
MAGGPVGDPAAQLAPSVQLKDPYPFSRRRQLLTVLQTPRGNILKYLSIQAINSAREFCWAAAGGVSHMTVLLAAIIAPVFEANVWPDSL